LERLRDFTDKALKRRETRRKSQIESEMAVNEEKLRHTRLIQDDDDSLSANMTLEAEFMPGPGSFKYKDSWISKGILHSLIIKAFCLHGEEDSNLANPLKRR
jgi:hypothetical protein